ncbi:C1 family peptidase [Alisedimentitalea sp. MJ-SS2]|uniref:C1 family peptidase n=1 Tax=Aliisedimentitalea sp. MJ-SS2 TaxID=3049795 RepID=UPI0029067E00|nr:C1 family peptidase [Alisedimentitalea sp. MJ-SS2]MDU8929928.1 C1 family peptidase [Alisedimentitalea sp. MJ-SS2]
MAAKKTSKRSKRGPAANRFVLNCVKSKEAEDDWTFGDAVTAEFLECTHAPPDSVDLREDWWLVRDQKSSGACVGFATADGVLRWHYTKERMINEGEEVSPRFIWMANKETDDFTRYPTSFLDSAGTSTKLALKVAKKYGCVLESMLPMEGRLSRMPPRAFFSVASQYRINAYYNLLNEPGCPILRLKHWIAHHGPVLTRLDVDEAFRYAQRTDGHLEHYNAKEGAQLGGHAVCLVGYTPDYLILRNSWGDRWGDNGFAYVHYAYFEAAFDEAYGAILNRRDLIVPDH